MKGVIRKSLGVAAGLLLFVPASALAGHASVEDGIARYDAAFGETNNVMVGELPDPSGGKLVVFRDVVPITVGGNCSNPIGVPNEARCLVADGVTRARAGLGNRDDRIAASTTIPPSTFGLSVEGDLGEDTLLGTAQRDVLDGVGGNDVIRGRAGNDGLEGGNGADDVKGEGGDDVLNGNDGSGGDLLDCGETTDDDDFATYNQGDTVFSNCELTQLLP
jgi:Ca2+-binding RTX toxin-like protein